MKKDLRKLIEEYLREVKLMQLATVRDGQPWVCNVWFAADEDLNIYWFSSTTRRHSSEVLEDNRVAAAFALPHTPQDMPRGLQVEGVAEPLTKKADVEKAISVYAGRIFPQEQIDKFMKDKSKPHQFYRIHPTLFVLFDMVNFPDESRQEYRL